MQMSGYCMTLRISFISHTDNESYLIWLIKRSSEWNIAKSKNKE
ncbi:hypothetical protein HMPREF2534_03313 [Bacteroides thetaiotaomicron]|nr:hypothetical protein HMPREF2534_03313 [Bacteroides thetaiotaomicron]